MKTSETICKQYYDQRELAFFHLHSGRITKPLAVKSIETQLYSYINIICI